MNLLRAMVVALLLAFFPGGAMSDDKVPPGVDLSVKKTGVSAILFDLMEVEVGSDGQLRTYRAYEDDPMPYLREWRTADGRVESYDAEDNASFPPEHYWDNVIHIPGVRVGEAVLISLTSDRIVGPHRTVITYNVGTQAYLSGGQLAYADPPLYYHTVPVENAADVFFQTISTSFAGLYHSIAICDSQTSPSIALSSQDIICDEVVSAATTRSFLTVGNPPLTIETVFEPIIGGLGPSYTGFFWSTDSSSPGTSRAFFMGSDLPVGEFQRDLVMETPRWTWTARSVGPLPTYGQGTFIYTVAIGGVGNVQELLIAFNHPRNDVYAIPARNLLLYAATEAEAGRATLSTHLFPHCDPNQNGRIDKDDLLILGGGGPSGVVVF